MSASFIVGVGNVFTQQWHTIGGLSCAGYSPRFICSVPVENNDSAFFSYSSFWKYIMEKDLCAYTFTDDDYDSFYQNAACLFLSGASISYSPELFDLCMVFCQEAKRRNVPVVFSMDTSSASFSIEQARKYYPQILRYVDILFAQNDELMDVLGCTPDNYHLYYPICKLFVMNTAKLTSSVYHCRFLSKQYQWSNDVLFVHTLSYEKPIHFYPMYPAFTYETMVAAVLHSIFKGISFKDTFVYGLGAYIFAHSNKEQKVVIDDVSISPYASTVCSMQPLKETIQTFDKSRLFCGHITTME